MAVIKGADGRVLLFAGRKALLATAGTTSPTTGGGTTTPTYATTFTVSAPSSMVVGTAYPVTITPSGTWPPNEAVALGLSGLAGNFANGTGNDTTPVVIQFTPSAAGNGFINASALGMTSAGNVQVTVASAQTTTPPVSSGPMSQVFAVSNWGSVTSPGVFKRGTWFKKGDVPAGSIPVLSGGDAQFYGLDYWKDGSLQIARLLTRDAPIAAGASRSYTKTTATGSMPAGAFKVIGNAGLVAALAGRDFKVRFDNVKDYQGNPYNGGMLLASLNAHAAVATRWELLTTGPVADVWQGWGMANNDPHLKVNWYMTRWKNADGSTMGWVPGAAPALDWWSIAGKTDLTYDATLLDGATTILSYPGVYHTYQSQWIFCINDGSNNAGRVPWVGAATPTLDYTFDKTYAILSGVMPMWRRDKVPPIGDISSYVPCNVVLAGGHRTYLDSGGPYEGRGPCPTYDAIAFMLQTPKAFAISRINALTGLSVPFHYRSNRQRTRSGEAADTANTNIPLLLDPKPASASDFTSQGLPIAVDAYRNGDIKTDNFVEPNRSPNYFWNTTSDTSHAVSYSFWHALVSGDEWFVDAQLDITLNMAHEQTHPYQVPHAPWAVLLNPACPSDKFAGLLNLWGDGPNIRALGWAVLIQGHGFGILPADHQYKPAADALMNHNTDYMALNLAYLPADFAVSGFFNGYLGPHFSPWMANFLPIGAYYHFALNEDVRWQQIGDFSATWTVEQAKAKRFYQWDTFRNLTRRAYTAWDINTNPNIPPAKQPFFGCYYDLDATGTFRQSGPSANWNDIGVAPPPLRNGDMVYFTQQGESGNLDAKTIPGVPEGTIGYIIGLTNGQNFSGERSPTVSPLPAFQVSATPGGTPMSFGGQTGTGFSMPTWVQSVSDPAYAVSSEPVSYTSFPYFFSVGNYIPIAYTALNMARHYGSGAVTADLCAQGEAFVSPTLSQTPDSQYYSAFDTVAIV